MPCDHFPLEGNEHLGLQINDDLRCVCEWELHWWKSLLIQLVCSLIFARFYWRYHGP